jgi:tRNA (cmo5U34)-methyltransferase
MPSQRSAFLVSYDRDREAVRHIAPHLEELYCALATEVAAFCNDTVEHGASCLELGCGSGYATAALLHVPGICRLIALDNDSTVFSMGSRLMALAADDPRVTPVTSDALSFLQAQPSSSVDIVASAMVLHSCATDYRSACLCEALRVLKPHGLFVAADRYAADPHAHHRALQLQVQRCFDYFLDLGDHVSLQEWVMHLLSDEAPGTIMKESEALDQMARLGFVSASCRVRAETDALLVARKPWPWNAPSDAPGDQMARRA